MIPLLKRSRQPVDDARALRSYLLLLLVMNTDVGDSSTALSLLTLSADRIRVSEIY